MTPNKKINLFDVFCIATGTMVSAGLFILPGIAQSKVGPAVFLSYLLAGFLSLISVLSQAELISVMPKAGGIYFHVARSMGPAVGSIYGLTIWLSLSLKSAFALLGIAALTAQFISIEIRVAAILLCFIFITINILGIKETNILQNAMVLVLLGILLVYILVGLLKIKTQYFLPFVPKGIGAIFSTVGFVFVSYGGLIETTSIAEEVENPRRTLPLGLLYSILAVIIIYTLTVFVTTGTLCPDKMQVSLTPVSDAAAVFWGGWGRILINIAALMAFVTTVNGGIMVASRYPLAAGRDGLLPNFFTRINSKFKTPHYSILSTGAFMVLVLFLDLEVFVKFASSIAIMAYMFSLLPVFIFRASKLRHYKPVFYSPFYPWLHIVGITGFLFLLFRMGLQAVWLSVLITVSTVISYIYCKMLQKKDEHALLYIVEKIFGRKYTHGHLESELKGITKGEDKNSIAGNNDFGESKKHNQKIRPAP